MTSPTSAENSKPKSSWLNLVVDYGPLLVFFLVYRHYAPKQDGDAIGTMLAITRSTIGFMIATVVALIVSKWRLGRISPMLWLTTVLIVGFGALTILLRDPFWIEIKPTAVYLMFAVVLFAGLFRGKPMLRYLLEAAFEGLTEKGWLKLSRNWAWFFLVLAIANTVLVYTVSFDVWLKAKVWGFTTASFLFTFSQIPLVMKHGMGGDAKDQVIENPPHD